jgi:RND family efflux transporter MFP subunit
LDWKNCLMTSGTTRQQLLCATVTVLLIGLIAMPVLAQDLAPSGIAKPVTSVKLISPVQGVQQASRTFFGRIAARETVDLSFEVGGHLVDLPVTEGRPVATGARVARLELGPFERAVERARVGLEQAQRVVDRTETLARQSAGSKVEAEDARSARDTADIALREAQAALDDATLTAPFDGLVAQRLTPNFANVSPGQPIVRLHDMSEVRVEIDVPERLFQATDPAAVAWTGVLPQVADPIPLTVVEYDAQTSSVGQTFRVSLALPELDIATLIPGASMSVIATVPQSAAEGVLLPATAILPGADRIPLVMVFADGTVRAVPVQVVSDTGTDLRVRGLPDDAQVVAVGGHLLTDGQEVRPYVGLSVQE